MSTLSAGGSNDVTSVWLVLSQFCISRRPRRLLQIRQLLWTRRLIEVLRYVCLLLFLILVVMYLCCFSTEAYYDMSLLYMLFQQMDINLLEEIVKRDPLSEISEQEKELLWRLR